MQLGPAIRPTDTGRMVPPWNANISARDARSCGIKDGFMEGWKMLLRLEDRILRRILRLHSGTMLAFIVGAVIVLFAVTGGGD